MVCYGGTNAAPGYKHKQNENPTEIRVRHAYGPAVKENPSQMHAREGFFVKILHRCMPVKDFS